VRHFLKNNHGATAIEYSVILAVVALVILAGITLVGEETVSHFENVADIAEENM